MIERVARILATRTIVIDGKEVVASWQTHIPVVREVLTAMREPTEAMILANSDAAGPDDEQTKQDWRAMIDAALAEG